MSAPGAAAQVEILGIRHHGPGSARAVQVALERLQPEVVLIEGPADADRLTGFVAGAGMQPPVALLAYATDAPNVAAFWPFAVFSPEWQALRWAADHDVPVRFCDLPSSAVLSERRSSAGRGAAPDAGAATAAVDDPGQDPGARPHDPADRAAPGGRDDPASNRAPDESDDPASNRAPEQPDDPASNRAPEQPDEPASNRAPEQSDEPAGNRAPEQSDEPAGPPPHDEPDDPEDPADEPERTAKRSLRMDPIATLAAAAGYSDPERWWDDVVEARHDGPTPFEVITEAMAELRAGAGREGLTEQRREAYMRQTLRAAIRGGASRVAVVCGAWHAPALSGKLPPATADARLLRGLPRRKTAVTWVPWTASRLSYASGYGAGIDSPGWYHHLFTAPDEVVARWLTRVAGVLRAQDLPVSSAHVIEAVRLADALAGLRGRPLAGLDEVTEATRAVLCDGDETALALVTGRLVVGEAMGTVPDDVPAVPLDADLRATARRLRLKQEPLPRTHTLDLRKPIDLDRSRLLHRLTFLGIGWGQPARSTVKATGTFRETWSLTWRPEFAVDVVEASMWGTTIQVAATAKAIDAAGPADLPALTRLVEQALLADLPDALTGLLDVLDERAARDLDAEHLMAALPPLVRAHRYSDVRGTDTRQLARVADALLVRICAALPAAVSSLDDTAARTLRRRLDAVHAAVLLRDEPRQTDQWLETISGLASRTDISGLLAGRMTRLLRDASRISTAEAAVRLGRALSVGTPAAAKAAWVEGFLDGGGLVLVHDGDLLTLLDEWVTSLSGQEFTDVLPLLRRTFGAFPGPERRAVGEAARRGPGSQTPAAATADADFDEQQALAALATVALILGSRA